MSGRNSSLLREDSMIVFDFMSDTAPSGRTIYIIGSISCLGVDKDHQEEIYEQLNAQEVGWA
jgi:hypothetical protein